MAINPLPVDVTSLQSPEYKRWEADLRASFNNVEVSAGSNITVTNGTFTGGAATIALSDNVSFTGDAAIRLTRGTTAQRPGTPLPGHYRYNTTTTKIEGYIGSSWENMATESYVTTTVSAKAPVDATYIVQTSDGTLTNEQVLASLSTGLMKNTNGTGVISIATSGTDYYAPGNTIPVVDGGTGATTAATARTNLGVAIGSDVQAYDATLAALASYNTNGLLTQTAADTFTGRTITAGSSKISVTNGDGELGNPTIDFGTVNINDLNDVTITTPSTGQVIKYNGTAWVNDTDSTGSGGISDGYTSITDGTNTSTASGSDTFKLRSADSKLSITVTNDDATHGDNALFTVNEANIDHDALTNFVANEHIDHSTVSISAGEGLTGGGTIAATRSLALDINGLTAESTVDGATDYVSIYDASAGAHRKVLIDDLGTGGGLSAATQADMETATSNTVATTPGTTQYHPGVAKAWVTFNGTGTVAISVSRNVSSITDVGTGQYTVNFTTAFSSANYAASAMAERTTSNNCAVQWDAGTAATASACAVEATTPAGFADLGKISIVFFGDQ